MDSYVRMRFGTYSGKDLTITVNNARSSLTSSDLETAMNFIVSSNAIAGEHQGISSIKDGKLYKVESQLFNFVEA